MELNTKYIDDITNLLVGGNKCYNNTDRITDYINVQIYSTSRRRVSPNGEDADETRAHIPIGIRKASSGFKRRIPIERINSIINYLTTFIPNNADEKVWVDVISVLQDSDLNEIHNEKLYGTLIDNVNYKDKIEELSEVLSAFCKNQSDDIGSSKKYNKKELR